MRPPTSGMARPWLALATAVALVLPASGAFTCGAYSRGSQQLEYWNPGGAACDAYADRFNAAIEFEDTTELRCVSPPSPFPSCPLQPSCSLELDPDPKAFISPCPCLSGRLAFAPYRMR